MLKSKKIILGAASLAATLSVMSVNVKASALSNRIYGQSRVETSGAIANAGWTKSDYAVIAYGWNFPDAISAAPLAYKYKAPILLTDKDKLSDNTNTELDNLEVKHVFIIGGTGAVSSDVEEQIKAKGIDVKRLCGTSRYETSIAIANEIDSSSSIVVTNGYNPYEALSISSIAAKKGMPIILTAKNEMPDAVQNYLKQNNITKTYVLGNANGVTDDDGVADNSIFNNTIRITGNNTYEKNINIIKTFDSDINYSKEYLVTGKSFADALTGSVLAAATSSPIIFVDDDMPQVTKDFIASKASFVANISILGGTNAVSDATAENAEVLSTSAIKNITYDNGDKYIGEFKDGKPNGQGTFTDASGKKYEGEFKDGVPNGHGIVTDTSGNKYEGEFKDGVLNGQGTLTSENGEKYEGEFKDGQPNGQGSLTYANGNQYEGEFKDGIPNGQGKLIEASGDEYEGQFVDGVLNGQGTLTNANGTVFQGEFKDGQYIGN